MLEVFDVDSKLLLGVEAFSRRETDPILRFGD